MSSQSELVEAIIGLNNMGDDWDAQHISELIGEWHNKQVEEVLDRLLEHSEDFTTFGDGSRSVAIEYIEAERIKLQACGDWQGIAVLTAMKLKEQTNDQQEEK